MWYVTFRSYPQNVLLITFPGVTQQSQISRKRFRIKCLMKSIVRENYFGLQKLKVNNFVISLLYFKIYASLYCVLGLKFLEMEKRTV